jgi:hypothetical protein
VKVSATSSNEEQTSGFFSRTGATSMGNAAVERRETVSDDGTLSVDVVAATADGGLVTDVSFTGKNEEQPKVRVAIFADGRLSYDPRQQLSLAATHVLPLLARGLVAQRAVDPGEEWRSSAPAPMQGTTTYRVTALRGEDATLAIDGIFSAPGPRGFSEHRQGTLVYATDRLCPLRYDVTAISRHQPAPEQFVTRNERVTATLVSDSFAKRK